MERITCVVAGTAKYVVIACQNKAEIRRTMTGNFPRWYPNEALQRTGNGMCAEAPAYPFRVIGTAMTQDPNTIEKIASRLETVLVNKDTKAEGSRQFD